MDKNITVDDLTEYDENTPLFSLFGVDPDDYSIISLADVGISMRAFNRLLRTGCRSLYDLLLKTISDLRYPKCLGAQDLKKTLAAVKKYIAIPRITVTEEDPAAARSRDIKGSVRTAVEAVFKTESATERGSGGDDPELFERIKSSVKFDQGFYTCKFGHYPQSSGDEPEPIEWIILDEKDGKFLLLSKYALNDLPYDLHEHNELIYGDNEKVCGRNLWHACFLRSWLNGSFLYNAFSDEEQKVILNTVIHDFGVRSTVNRVFLLSETEVDKYFSCSYDERKCKVTEYCREQGAVTDEDGNCWWWLRTTVPFMNEDENVKWVELVGNEGSVIYSVMDISGKLDAVRPAMWVDLNS